MNNTSQEIEITVERIPTGIEGATEADDIFISTRALEMINEIRRQNNVPDNYFLRMGVQGGGCSGFNYALGFDSELDALNDIEFFVRDTRIVVDRRSLFYLMGITLDFVDTPQGRGFIFSNPNNLPTCGCQG
ncbi:MAG: iron-sulfur cluster assembly accessory protein [Ignavibacteria bacterium]|nr:iron-sulfur cluster assembly accessory protein [Ignavibacteria bacterium]